MPTTINKPFLQVQDLAKTYSGVAVIEHVHSGIERGEFACVIGHSGCG